MTHHSPIDIARVAPIAIKVRQLNERLWDLHRLSVEGLATPEEEEELDRMCAELEALANAAEEAAPRSRPSDRAPTGLAAPRIDRISQEGKER